MNDAAREKTASAARRVLVIRNPTSGRRRIKELYAVLKLLDQFGCAVNVRETTCAHHATVLAKRAISEGFDVIVAAGGDGTVNEVASALTERSPPLGVIPLGTANVLAWEIGLGRRTDEVARTIAFGEPRPITIGRVNGRCFLLMVGIGYDGAVVAGISPRIKRRLGKAAYLLAAIAQLWRYSWPQLSVTINGAVRPCAMAIIAKARSYAGRWVLVRDANLEDSSFRVCLFARGGVWNVLRYAVALMLGRLARLPDVAILSAENVEISSPAAVAVQADGEAIGATPVAISIVQERIRVLWPNER